MTLWQWLFYTEDQTQTSLTRLENEVMALSAEVKAEADQKAQLLTGINNLVAAVNALLASVGQPGLSAEDKAQLGQDSTDMGGAAQTVNALAQKVAAATVPAPAA